MAEWRYLNATGLPSRKLASAFLTRSPLVHLLGDTARLAVHLRETAESSEGLYRCEYTVCPCEEVLALELSPTAQIRTSKPVRLGVLHDPRSQNSICQGRATLRTENRSESSRVIPKQKDWSGLGGCLGVDNGRLEFDDNCQDDQKIEQSTNWPIITESYAGPSVRITSVNAQYRPLSTETALRNVEAILQL